MSDNHLVKYGHIKIFPDVTCIICLEKFPSNKTAKCCYLYCKNFICVECLQGYLNHCLENLILPKCVAQSCSGIFLLDIIESLLDENFVKIYCKTCYKFLDRSEGPDIDLALLNEKILKNIREERIQFISDKFPSAISFVANIAFGSKMKKLDKQRKDKINSSIKENLRKCIVTTCNGFIDDKLQCTDCFIKICPLCNMKLLENHSCNIDDIESVNLINSLVKCPGCKLPIFKSEGCNLMTCTNCDTNFMYDTGLEGGSGNKHNMQLKKKRKDISLHEQYSLYIENKDVLKIVIDIEQFKPVLYDRNIILKYLKKYKKNPSIYDIKKVRYHTAKKIQTYYDARNKYIVYQKHMQDLESLIISKSLDLTPYIRILEDVKKI